jgi:hypothetical protein
MEDEISGFQHIRFCRSALKAGQSREIGSALDYGAEVFAACFAETDHREGMSAFAE